MYRREHRDQLSFKDFFLRFGGQLSGGNRWIKLADLIPWDELEDDYASKFCKGFGAPAKPFRMALGAMTFRKYVTPCLPFRRPASKVASVLHWDHLSAD